MTRTNRLSLLALALSTVFPLATQAAMTFTPGAQPATTPTFSGTMAVPQYQIAWRWGTNNITGLDARFADLTESEKKLTFLGSALQSTTLLVGYTPFGVNPGAPFVPAVTWGSGVTTDVSAQEKFIRLIEAPILNAASGANNVRIGTAKMYLSGVTSGIGGGDIDGATQYFILGLDNNTNRGSCAGVPGSSRGMVAGSSSTSVPASFPPLRDRLQALLNQAAGVILDPLPATNADSLAYLNRERSRVGGISQGGVSPVVRVNVETRSDNSFFGSPGQAVGQPKLAAEYRCAIGFTGLDANEKIVLTFDNPITATTEWRIVLTPTVTYS